MDQETGQNNTIAPVPGKPASLLSRLRNKLSSLFFSLKTKWNALPRRKKIPVAGLGTLLTVGLILLIVQVFSPYKPFDFLNREGPLVDSGVWEKLNIPERDPAFFTLSPESERKFGLKAQDTLILKTTKSVTPQFLEENIVSSLPLKITAINDKEFSLIPTRPLATDEAFTVTFDVKDAELDGYKFDRNYNWGFQAQPKFKVVSTLPENERVEVPINTGIEITFNIDGYKDPRQFLSVSPGFEYRVERKEQTLIIVPLQPLTAKTKYQITLKRGLGLENGSDTISEDKTLTFQTADNNASSGKRISIADNLQQTSPGQTLLTKVRTQNWNDDESIKSRVYKFGSTEAFVNSRAEVDKLYGSWERYYPEQYMINTNGLSKVSEADVKVQNKDGISYIQFPGNWDEGLYIVQLEADGGTLKEQLWIQSTPIAGYVSAGKEQSVIWLNNIGGGASKNTSVSVLGGGSAYSTNDQGWATFPTPQIFFEKSQHYLEATTTENKKLLIPVRSLSGSATPGSTVSDDYWGYIYNERQLYRPDDTIYFWGVAKNRDTNSVPNSVQITLGESPWGETSAFATQNVTPSGDGSFFGSIKIDNAETGWTYLTAKVGDVQIASSSITISEFVKPELKIEVTTDKKAVFAGEKVEFKARIGFFDGTPASNMPLNIYKTNNGGGEGIQMTTNKDGEVSYSYEVEYNSNSYYPRYEGITVSPAQSSQSELDGYGSVYVYGSRLFIDNSSKQEGDQAKIEAKVSNLSLDKLNSGESSEVRAGVAKGQKVQVNIKKTWYEKKQKSTYYDFVEKVTRPTYDYIHHEEVFQDREFTTNDSGDISHSFTMEKEKSYIVKITTKDRDGHETTTSEYFYYYDGPTQDDRGSKSVLDITKEKNIYTTGEKVELTIKKDGTDYKDTDKNEFLFILANRGRQDVSVKGDPKYDFTFQDTHKPNVFVGATIFTGDHYEEVSSTCKQNWVCPGYDYYDYHNEYGFKGIQINYEEEDSKLDLEIQFDQAKYSPGAKAEVRARVTKNGNAIDGASVQLVLVDEALAAMGAVHEPSILSTLYSSTDSYIYYSYFTHKAIFPDIPQAEQGGGGGDRTLFKDTAFFSTAKTNNEGVAVFEVQLPDNITSWVTYAQAITGNLDAGHTESKTAVTKDFFVTSKFPSQIIVRDQPVLAFNIFGKALNSSNQATIEAIFSRNSTEIDKKTQNTKAFQESYSPFPKLGLGSYNVAVRSQFGNTEDGVILPLEVIESRLEFEAQKKFELNANQTLNTVGDLPSKDGSNLKLIISDIGKGQYYYNLQSYCYKSSNRVEKRLVKVEASRELAKNFDDGNCGNNADLSEFQAVDGGIRQVGWGSSSIETSLWATYLDANAFDKEKLRQYFERYSPDSYGDTQSKIYSAWGLTLLGYPKVNDLKLLSQRASSYNEKVTVALALTSAGLTEEARETYYDLLSDYAYTNKPYVRIQSGATDMDTYLLDTANTLLLGSLVDQNYNEGMNLYLRDYRTAAEDIILDVANIAFIRNQLANLPKEKTTIAFRSASENINQDILPGRIVSVELTPTEAKNFTLNVLAGKAEALVSYSVAPQELDKLLPDDRIEISRSFKKVAGSGDKIFPGDIVEVTVSYDFDRQKAPLGCYEITEHISSGLTYIENPHLYGLSSQNKIYMHEDNKNIAQACAYNSPWWQTYSNYKMTYFAKANAAGTYIMEPTIMQSRLDPSIFQKTQEETITIERHSN